MKHILSSLKIGAATILVCCVVYPAVVFGFARFAAGDSSEGSLIRDGAGRVVGSRLIAQKFTRPQYFWPRPSAVDFNAAAAGGSNKSSAGPALRERALSLIALNGASASRPIPADLIAASGSGLDPHITIPAARFQIPRVAAARNINPDLVDSLVQKTARTGAGPFSPVPLVNVLELNLALDRMR